MAYEINRSRFSKIFKNFFSDQKVRSGVRLTQDKKKTRSLAGSLVDQTVLVPVILTVTELSVVLPYENANDQIE